MTEGVTMVAVRHRQATSILSKAGGFASSFDYTLNPYSGCAFACSYCYAAFFAPTEDQKNRWGEWVDVKDNALDLLRRKRKRPLIDKSVYMSSVTDPYQPVERQLELTRAILAELLEHHRVRLVVQTRAPLVTRDIDLLKQFETARVQMTITTDDDEIRRVFEPLCASTAQRLEAARTLVAAGVDTSICMTPLLPVRDPVAFADALRETGVRKFVTQNFHPANRRFVAGTSEATWRLLAERKWDAAHYAQVRRILCLTLPEVREGRAGFVPVW
jgi:DNA repair photolyase